MHYINEIMMYRLLQIDFYSNGSSWVLRPNALSFESQHFCFKEYIIKIRILKLKPFSFLLYKYSEF